MPDGAMEAAVAGAMEAMKADLPELAQLPLVEPVRRPAGFLMPL
jgi:hypothetical protein